MARAEPFELADQALANLVNQFARPLDFLRELVQNSIDAGSPRVEVWLRYVPEGDTDPPTPGLPHSGVLEIHVDDFGEGMDDAIIESHLTRLFSSTKENDLTKIGKFGIGFTSIFAIEPDAVLLQTGRHGECWELLFHADRTFEKSPLETPMAGTQITLFKRMPQSGVGRFVRECKFILTYWCEHSNTPITFWDRTEDVAQAPASEGVSEDPFAAFAVDIDVAQSRPEAVNSPLAVDALLSATHSDRGMQAVAAYGEEPRYGFYNGGLTLLNTQNVDVLGKYGPRLRHLSFKVKSDGLEHTLTRDNVLQDSNWHFAMGVVLQAAAGLRKQLIIRTVRAVLEGEPIGRWHQLLEQETLLGPGVSLRLRDLGEHALFRDQDGQPRTMSEVHQQASTQGVVLFVSDSPVSTAVIEHRGLFLLEDLPQTRSLLASSYTIASIGEIWVAPGVTADERLTPGERQLLDDVRGLLAQVRSRPPELQIGEFGGPEYAAREPLAVLGEGDEPVFRRPVEEGDGFTWFSRQASSLLINRFHSRFQTCLFDATQSRELAAFTLAQALLVIEGREGDEGFAKLAQVVAFA